MDGGISPLDDPRYAYAPQNPLGQYGPSWADAADWHARNLADTYAAMREPQTWVDAARQYGNALLMGTTGPRGVLAYHGTTAGAPFTSFDLSRYGSGAFADTGVPAGAQPAFYLTSEPAHAESYANYGDAPLKFNVAGKLKQIDAVPLLKDWATELGYKGDAQRMINEYFEGSAYQAMDADNFFSQELHQALKEGHDGITVDFGDLRNNLPGHRFKMGKVHVLSDPSLATPAGE